MTSAAEFTTLVTTFELASHLDRRDWVVVDCRFDLADPAAGERAYRESHIPGAVYASLDRDLSGAKTGKNGRHPLPDHARLAQTFGNWGITSGIQVVACDQDSGMYASRLWWLLRYLGHEAVAVLDGGMAKWLREGGPTVAGVETRRPQQFSGTPRRAWQVTVADLERLVGQGVSGLRLVDARSPERFQGLQETLDPVAGHIPGAWNHFFKTNLGADGTFLDPSELRRQWTDTLGAPSAEGAIIYCGSGVTACHNLLALERAGLTGARLYPGSWSEWSSDPERPIEQG